MSFFKVQDSPGTFINKKPEINNKTLFDTSRYKLENFVKNINNKFIDADFFITLNDPCGDMLVIDNYLI